MKKRLFSLLIIVLCLALCGCTKSKEDLLEKATDIQVSELAKAIEENTKNAKDEYVGNVYTITAGVMSVDDDYAIMQLFRQGYKKSYMKVYFNSEDLKELKSDTKIQFVGIIDDIETSDDDTIVTVKNAYYVSDYIIVTGQMKCWPGYDRCYFYEGAVDDANAKYKIDGRLAYISGYQATIKDTTVDGSSTFALTFKAEFDQEDYWNITDIKAIEVIKK